MTEKVEERGDLFNHSRSEILKVEDADLVGTGLTVSRAFDCSHYWIRGECQCHLQGFPLGLLCY